jgi:hypothetical protein
MKKIALALLICSVLPILAQNNSTEKKKKKGSLYVSFGYTRAAYSKSTIHFSDNSNAYHDITQKNNNYDFTIYDAKAHDRPDFDKIADLKNFSIPQYVYRMGYYFNNRRDFGIEGSFDHTKYVVTDYQRVRIKGHFNGTYVDKDTTLDPRNFLHFEHSDGANFLMINLLKRWKLVDRPLLNIGWVVKPGAGVVIPRTDVTLFGERLNNKFHVAGYIVGLESGIRTEFLKYGFFEFVAKGSYANFMQVLVCGAGSKANHHFYTGQLTATIGLMVGL